jgi:hypothetical protein
MILQFINYLVTISSPTGARREVSRVTNIRNFAYTYVYNNITNSLSVY